MGRKNKAYRLSLHQQIYNRLTSMQAFGESKQQGKADGTMQEKIYSYPQMPRYGWSVSVVFHHYSSQQPGNVLTISSKLPGSQI